jgi:CheY-like chemotaxis protein
VKGSIDEVAEMTQVQPNIVIVEDDFISQQVLIAMLSCYPVTTYCASSGQEALQLIAACSPQLLLLDHELPDMTGITLHQLLTQQSIAITAALISAHSVEQLTPQAHAAGIAQVLHKPVEPQQLVNLLRITGCI